MAVPTPDLCIIGAGPAGLAAAAAARERDATVVVIERDRVGGTSLYDGAVPSRALAAVAARAHAVRTASRFGLGTDEPKINFGRIHDHIQSVIAGLAPAASPAQLEALGVELIRAEARFVDRQTVKAGDRLVRAKHVIIATGAELVLPAISGLSEVPHFTQQSIFENTRRPGHLAVVGAGPVAVELAQSHRRLGCDVTLLSPGAALPDVDAELAGVVLRRLREEGVAVEENAFDISVVQNGAGLTIRFQSGAEASVAATHLLVVAGRRPALDQLNLSAAGIHLAKTDTARLELDARLHTTNRRVYAIGDAAGGPQSTHVAVHQARLAVEDALSGRAAAFDLRAAPSVICTDPEIAQVGLTEADARAAIGDRVRVLRAAFAENHKAQILRDTGGLARLVLDDRGRILGAGVVGPGAGELVALFALASANGLEAHKFGGFVAAYPTFSEVAHRLAEAAGGPPPRTSRMRFPFAGR
jgi:pyruvate/2-oxoglutarate dehydrogenase complex dihydrolipoamide dehydrogenase (E3) component